MVLYDSLSYSGGREINEDSLEIVEKGGGFLFALADGLGGHGRGEDASKAAVTAAKNIFLESACFSHADCFEGCQNFVMSEQKRLNAVNEMKTTLVLLHIAEKTAVSGHIGDSRLYFFRNKRLKFQSLDHSVPQTLAAIGEIKQSDIRGHEDRSRLLRVMGVEWDVPKYELHPTVKIKPKDCFLLCSDGFWEWIEENDMLKTLKASDSPAKWLSMMREIVLENGSGHNMDNYTAIAVWIK